MTYPGMYGWNWPTIGYGTSVITPAVFDESLTLYEQVAALRSKMDDIIAQINASDSSIDDIIAQLNASMASLTVLVNSFAVRITALETGQAAFEANTLSSIADQFIEMRAELQAMLDEYKRDTDTYVFSYVSGMVDTLQHTLNNYWDWLRPNAFTALEFDAYGFTVDDFETMPYSELEFETKGKTLFPKTDGLHTRSPYTGALVSWKQLAYQILQQVGTAPTIEVEENETVDAMESITVY